MVSGRSGEGTGALGDRSGFQPPRGASAERERRPFTPPSREVAAERPEGVRDERSRSTDTPSPLRGEPPEGGGSVLPPPPRAAQIGDQVGTPDKLCVVPDKLCVVPSGGRAATPRGRPPRPADAAPPRERPPPPFPPGRGRAHGATTCVEISVSAAGCALLYAITRWR